MLIFYLVFCLEFFDHNSHPLCADYGLRHIEHSTSQFLLAVGYDDFVHITVRHIHALERSLEKAGAGKLYLM